MSTSTHFVDTLCAQMRKYKLSVRKLADMSGLAPGTIQRLKSGKSEPRKDSVDAIANALGIDPMVLWAGAIEDAVHDDVMAENLFERERELQARSAGKPSFEVVTGSAGEVPVVRLSLVGDFLKLGGNGNYDAIALPPETIWWANSPTPDFAVIAETATMSPAVADGDILYFKRDWPQVKTGQIVLAETESGDVRLGRIKRDIFDAYLAFDNGKAFNLNDIKIKSILSTCVGLYRQFL